MGAHKGYTTFPVSEKKMRTRKASGYITFHFEVEMVGMNDDDSDIETVEEVEDLIKDSYTENLVHGVSTQGKTVTISLGKEYNDNN